ncbi:MAG TPA: hypothetical protein VNG35_12185 [Gemmatimonadales bacterium]|nr:hypothetical protein [Gemmatimonadales bacterium]
MGRYVGNKWHEELPSSGPADQQQGNNVPVSSGGGGGGGGAPAGATGGAPSGAVAPGSYNTVNGPRTLQQMQQELQNVGYSGPTDSTSILVTYGNTTGQAVQPIMSGAPGTATAPVAATTGTNADTQKLIAGIQQLLGAQASGNKDAIAEAIREFNANFGLDTQKFQDDVRRFNENLQISQAGLTGMYQGTPTQAGLLQAQNIAAQNAGLTGYYVTPNGLVQGTGPGQETLAAQAQYAGLYGNAGQAPVPGQTTLAAQQQAYAQQMGAINAAAALQANPFRQAQVIGQAGRVLQGLPTAGFSAPNTVAGVGTAGGNTQGGMGYLQQLIDDIKSPQANQTTAQSWLDATPTPNKIDSASFLRSTPTTQNLILQSMQEKYGLDPQDSLKQIQNTLPQFNAPNTVGVIRRG